MAEEPPDEAAGEVLPPPPKPTRYITLIILIMILEAGGGYLFLDYMIPAREVAHVVAKVEVEVTPSYVKPAFFDGFADMIVNPAGASRQMLVMFSMSLELGVGSREEAALEELEFKRDFLWDKVLQQLERLPIKEIRDPEKTKFKATVIKAVNDELRNGSIVGVYITKFVLQ